MGSIKIWLDDVNQVYLTKSKNLKYELFQADEQFGFNDVDVTNLTTLDIDKLLIAKSISVEHDTSQSVDCFVKSVYYTQTKNHNGRKGNQLLGIRI